MRKTLKFVELAQIRKFCESCDANEKFSALVILPGVDCLLSGTFCSWALSPTRLVAQNLSNISDKQAVTFSHQHHTEMFIGISQWLTTYKGLDNGYSKFTTITAGLFIGCMLRWRHLVNACEVKAHLIGCRQNLGAVCFWQSIPSGLNPVVAAVLRDSLCVVSLLPCMADCCMLYTVCKVEWFVLTIIKQKLLLSIN